jgi:tetratricopeptide (TPR) repeat protein
VTDASVEALADLADERRRAGEALVARGELATALDTMRQELDLRRRLAEHAPADAEKRVQVSRTAARIAEMLVFRSAVAMMREGVNVGREAARPHDVSSNFSWTLRSAGSALAAQGDAAGALALHRESLAIRRELAARDPKHAALRLDISWSLAAIADILDAKGDLKEALVALRESLAIRRALSAADPGNDGLRCDVAASLTRIADILAEQGDRAGALAAYREAREIACALHECEPGVAERCDDLATIDARIAELAVVS